MYQSKKITVSIADDHTMLRKGIINLLAIQGKIACLFDVNNGNEVIEYLKKHIIPDILILDVTMAGKDGLETAKWVTTHYPQIKILALSMHYDESTILKMIQAGAKGYISKRNDPEMLLDAIKTIHENGVYLEESLSSKIFLGIQNNILLKSQNLTILNEKEKTFLSLLCQELPYKEIARRMFLSPRTVDDYTRKLAKRLSVKGKAGLIVYAVNNKLDTFAQKE
jgi:DNA-binding NarL/FixJ family response regulator